MFFYLSNLLFSDFLQFRGGEIRDTKTLNLSRNIVSLQVLVDVSRFSPCVITLSRNRNICCGLKNVVVKRRTRVYFEQQGLALLLVFHQTHNLSRNKSAHVARQVEGFCILYFAALKVILYTAKITQNAVTELL